MGLRSRVKKNCCDVGVLLEILIAKRGCGVECTSSSSAE